MCQFQNKSINTFYLIEEKIYDIIVYNIFKRKVNMMAEFKKKTYIMVIGGALLVLTCIIFVSSFKSIKSINLDKQNEAFAVGESILVNYKLLAYGYEDYETYNMLECSSSNENVAVVERISENEFRNNECTGFIKISAVGVGKCTITVKAGKQMDIIELDITLNPQIAIYPQKDNVFLITTYLPEDSKIKVSLVGENHIEEREVILEKESNYPTEKTSCSVSFQDSKKEINGKYTIIVQLCELVLQAQSVKNVIGNNGEFLVGEQVVKTEQGNEVYISQVYDLPYKTDLEKIRETDFSHLTEEQRITISRYLKSKFDYYHEEYNGYWVGEENGSREYIHNVVRREGATRYNKTIEQMEELWNFYILNIPPKN